ncbi:hypothetical protein OAK66_03010 [Candidatus Nitrosopelagicus sp.]|nr:hypothetical protein [Candidatus Nitrosopelagicus sp.]MDC0241382.1 hypothetical protein [Candidatus Nitrosopelagicus sp.]
MKTKNTIPENKIDELKALIARSILIRIEQKKIEAKLHEIAKYYDEESLKSIYEPIGESMMSIVGLDLPRKHPKESQKSKSK